MAMGVQAQPEDELGYVPTSGLGGIVASEMERASGRPFMSPRLGGSVMLTPGERAMRGAVNALKLLAPAADPRDAASGAFGMPTGTLARILTAKSTPRLLQYVQKYYPKIYGELERRPAAYTLNEVTSTASGGTARYGVPTASAERPLTGTLGEFNPTFERASSSLFPHQIQVNELVMDTLTDPKAKTLAGAGEFVPVASTVPHELQHALQFDMRVPPPKGQISAYPGGDRARSRVKEMLDRGVLRPEHKKYYEFRKKAGYARYRGQGVSSTQSERSAGEDALGELMTELAARSAAQKAGVIDEVMRISAEGFEPRAGARLRGMLNKE